MAWFKRLFSGQKDVKPAEPQDSESKLANMPFPELLQYCSSFTEGMPWDLGISLVRRLFDVAYHERTTEPHHRKNALELVDGLIKDMEANISANPTQLNTFREAYMHSKTRGESYGYGTLFYELQDTPADKVFNVMVARRNSHLVSQFVDLVGTRDVWEPHKSEILRTLIEDRALRASDNIVFVLYSLLHTRDQTAWYFLTEAERAKLLNADIDYTNARDVLVAYGLLPSCPTSMSYLPVPESGAMLNYLIAMMQEKDPAAGVLNTEVEACQPTHGESFVICTLLMLTLLRLALAFNILRGIYGEAIGQQFKAQFLEKALPTSGERISKMVGVLLNARERSCDPTHPNNDHRFDWGVTAIGMQDLFESTDDEEQKNKKLEGVNGFIARELSVFPGFFRYLLRAMIHGGDKLKECLIEDALTG